MTYIRELNNEGISNSKYTMETSDYLNIEISESNTEVLEIPTDLLPVKILMRNVQF